MTAAITLNQARSVIDAALAEARRHGHRPMAVVVVDTAAQIVACAREDGATALRVDIALGKAAAAAGMGANSRALAVRAKESPAFFMTISTATQQAFVPQTGALLIRDATGLIIGAAGASGGTGDEDEQIVKAGIEAAGLESA